MESIFASFQKYLQEDSLKLEDIKWLKEIRDLSIHSIDQLYEDSSNKTLSPQSSIFTRIESKVDHIVNLLQNPDINTNENDYSVLYEGLDQGGRDNCIALFDDFFLSYRTSERRKISLNLNGNAQEENDQEYRDKALHFLSSDPPSQSYHEICEMLSVNDELLEESVLAQLQNRSADIFSRLLTQPEPEIQAILKAWIIESEDHMAIDCSGGSGGCPWIKQHPEAATFQGKPDMASLSLPFYVEFKDLSDLKGCKSSTLYTKEYYAIAQALERIQGVQYLNETVRWIGSIATCGRGAWLLIVKRDYKTKIKKFLEDTLSIVKINIHDILPLFITFSQKGFRDPSFYLHPDAPVVASMLSSLGLHPGFTRVKLLSLLNSQIYEVQGAKKDRYIPNAPKQSNTFLIKINGDDQRGLHEVGILAELMKFPPDNPSPISYVISTLIYDPQAPNHTSTVFDEQLLLNGLIYSYSLRKNGNVLRDSSYFLQLNLSSWSEANRDRVWFTYPSTGFKSVRSAIAMRKGEDASSIVSSRKLFASVEKDLEACWTLGIAHTDLRSTNFICLDGRLCIIDYDSAVKKDQQTDNFVWIRDLPPGARRDCMEEALQKRKDPPPSISLPLKWTIDDEKEMLFSGMTAALDPERKMSSRSTTPKGSVHWNGHGYLSILH